MTVWRTPRPWHTIELSVIWWLADYLEDPLGVQQTLCQMLAVGVRLKLMK